MINDFFVNLSEMETAWAISEDEDDTHVGIDRATGATKCTGVRVDLMFGSNSQPRALAENYAQGDADETFVRSFVAAWTEVTNADRFDLR